MTEREWVEAIVTLFGSGGAVTIIGLLIGRAREKRATPPVTSAEAQEAVVAVEAQRAGVPDPVALAATVRALEAQAERDRAELEAQLDGLRASLAELQREHRVTVSYAWALREQVTGLGAQPLPWPEELAAFHAPSSIRTIREDHP